MDGSEPPVGTPETFDIAASFAALASPGAEIQAILAGQSLRMVQFQGTGGWHRHDTAEETVIVWSGTFDVEYRTGTVRLEKGHCTVIPRGLEHRGVSDGGAHILLLRPAA